MTALDRRDFLKVTAAAGGLLFGVSLPGCARLGQGQQSGSDPSLFVAIGADDTITITIARSEMGQGVRTSLAMLVAEELDADWARIRITQASYDPRYPPMGTGGSGSIRNNWTTLREAGARVRAMLISAAAAEWSVPAGECDTEPSRVVHRASGRRATYGSLAERAARLPVPEQVTLKRRVLWRILGRDARGLDVPDIVHGRAGYGIDVKVPGMLCASVERATVFGATVRSFDASAARQVPGVVDVVELPAVPGDVGTHAGIAVVADHTWAAMEGRRALRVEWDPGPHAGESDDLYRDAMARALAQPGQEMVNRFGDPEAVLAGAARVYLADFDLPFLSHATMEPQNCTAHVTADGAELWAPTQFPDWATNAVAAALELPAGKVRVHVTLLGGGFGRRINPDYAVEAALLAQKLGRPVKVTWTREDDLRHDFYRPCARHRIETTLGANGYPEAWRHRITTPAIDASGRSGNGGRKYGASESDGASNMAYRVPNRSCEYTLLASGVPRGWWRAVHTTHTVFAVESMIDELAAAAGIDPLEYRLALIDQLPGPQQPSRFPFEPDRLRGVLRLAAEKAGWGRTLPAGRAMGIAAARDHLIYAAEVVEVSIRNGRLRIHKVVCAADCGQVINPTGARAQLHGGVIQALSAALRERITIAGGAVEQRNFDSYPILRINEAPLLIESHFVPSEAHPLGLGEPSVPPLAPALANAIARAGGPRLRSLPITLPLS